MNKSFLCRLLLTISPAAGAALLLSVAAGLNAPQSKTHSQGKPSALTGEQVFRQQCASCHGAKGEGTKQYARPLTGSRSAKELTTYIAQSMPPGPRHCSAADAPRVAAYIFDTFYSPIAQARNNPARVVLSRLTVRQFRNAVTDLVSGFRPTRKPDATPGLHAEYFKARRFQNDERLVERTDPEVRFDFGQNGPIPDKFDPYQFSIRWTGSVTAPDTGEYEFIVHSDHAVRLWVNDQRQPLIDAWVKSGKDTEFHGSLFLVGGHAYPLRLEFSKSTQGVDDTKKQTARPIPKAFITLAWKRPKQAEEPVPARCLLPTPVSEAYVSKTPFPPDDRSTGYERGTSVNKAWDEATTAAALETTAYVTTHLRELSGVPDEAKDRTIRLQAFCRQFVERAFRRPLTAEVAQVYIDHQFKNETDPTAAVKRVVLLTLKSPRFLYREVGSEKPDAYDVASRLSFTLWDSLPDAELMKAAASGELNTTEQIARQAERMTNDPRAASKLHDFFLQWLKVEASPDLAKDAKKFPGFDAAVASDLRTSLELSLASVLDSERADFRELMLSDKVFLNGRLAKLYNVNLPADAGFQPVALDTGERAGLLTHPYLLSSFAYVDTSSPIHRGVLIIRSLLGRVLQPPPAAFTPLPANLHPNLTTRQRVALQTKPAACSGCHSRINPLGFTLERFDAIGRVRTQENGQPIDCSGAYEESSGKTVKFAGARDLANYVANSDEAHAAFVEKLFQNLVKQPVRAYGTQTLPTLERAFTTNNYNIRRLMAAIATETARPPEGRTASAAEEPGRKSAGLR